MKKLLALFLVLAALLSLSACKSESNPQSPAGPEETASDRVQTDKVPTLISQTEYVLYQNIFFNKQAEDYVNKKAVKEGTFVRLEDRYNDVTRYYVWGYYDNTKCCDWQWEFVPEDPASLPPNGSLVKMTGTLARDEAALDKLWFVDATVETVTRYEGPTADADLCCMSATLERVQLANMQHFPGDFEGRTVRVYGRVLGPAAIQHPYYDNVWTQDFQTDGAVPAIGTEVIVSGTWTGGSVTGAEVRETRDY